MKPPKEFLSRVTKANKVLEDIAKDYKLELFAIIENTETNGLKATIKWRDVIKS